ncbi:MAG: hypothetical protein RL477_314 [Pseudomonadota bacterium]|jgi:BirA family biotin operon repressor/biotin-[acetyl-CoA-carboxylase] ligase
MAAPLPSFFRRVALDQTTSTNDEALKRAREGAPEGMLVTARRQTAGRGRRGREWVSPPGNLHLSIVLRPDGGLAAATAIGFAAALAARDAMIHVLPTGAPVTLKWPNDVLIGGAKAAGLLIEAAGEDALVLGVGINVVAHPEDAPYPATSIRAAGGEAADEDVLCAFCASFGARYDRFRANGMAELRADWLAHAQGLGAAIGVNIEGARFDGIFAGIDEAGALLLDLGGAGTRTVTAGDVFFAAGQRAEA